ncbi:MAG: winged helix-turn-helix transcriptional regulator [Methanoregula sp.]
MRHCYRKISIFIVFLVLIAPVPITALPNDGIVVSPGYAAIISDPPDDVTKISFWELSPRAMLLFTLVAISPILVFPVELFLVIKVFLLLGIRRLTKTRILDHESRMEIYDEIMKKPGISISQMVLLSDMNRGTLKYHLSVLEKSGKVTHISLQGNSLFFENSGKFSELEKRIVQNLKSEAKVKIFNYLLKFPMASRIDLAEALDVSGPTVSWHMQHLCNETILFESREGKEVKYRVNPEVVPYLRKYLYESFLPASLHRESGEPQDTF